ncbi:sigma-70 family RNA polymerase sigma factor [Phreatobacter sp.]|uniref:sigma-70 family RNA polymerase sigma factor n=1 Tax=Phreatobacter sp. TaxID=1966341 RepID=UPI003F708344
MGQCIAAIAASQDRAAFEELFRYFAPRVEAYLRRLGSPQPAAEELMQEAMVTVWRKAGQFDPAKASASTWLFTIVRNLRIDAYRREKRPELDPDDPALAREPDPQADALLSGQQSADRLRDALRLLNDNERIILNLAYFDDKSHSEIAAELGLPLGTVKSRIRLAFAKLRNALGASLGEEL